MVRALLGILLPIAVGLPFMLWLRSWPARLAMAFLGGMVVITGGLTVIGAAGFRFTAVTLAPLTGVWLVAAALATRRSWATIRWRPSWPRDWSWPAWILLGLAAMNVATAAAYAMKAPIADTDVVVIWLPKAVLIATEGFKALARSVYPDYPPLWPLHIYLADGGSTWLKLLPSAYLVATLVLVFDYVRSRVGPVVASACVLAISGVPYIWLPYGVNDLMSEVPTMAFVTASTMMLAEYVDHPNIALAAVTGLTAAGAVWVRPEGFFHALLIGAILVIAGYRLHRVRQTLLPAGGIVIAFVVWRLVVRLVFHYSGGLGPNPAALSPPVVLSALADTIRYAAANIGNPYLFGPALIAVACIALAITRWRSFGVVGLVLAVDIAIGVATYVALPSTNVGEPLIWWLTTGFKRMLLHVTPLLYVTAALAVGSLFLRSDSTPAEAQTRQPPGWAPRRGIVLSVMALAAACLVIAGYAAYQVGGPKAYDLSEMGPSHVAGTTADYAKQGTISLSTTEGTQARLIYYLQITGRRLPPLDNISGSFSNFSATVEARESGAPAERFTASVDGRLIAEVTAAPGSGRLTLSGRLPPGGRFLELDVTQLGPGTGNATWIQPTVYRATAWWAVEALLGIALGVLAASALVWSRVLGLGDRRVLRRLTPASVAIPLLAAAAVQQVEAIAEVALPAWSFAFRVLGGFA